jgi:hypothetical protein
MRDATDCAGQTRPPQSVTVSHRLLVDCDSSFFLPSYLCYYLDTFYSSLFLLRFPLLGPTQLPLCDRQPYTRKRLWLWPCTEAASLHSTRPHNTHPLLHAPTDLPSLSLLSNASFSDRLRGPVGTQPSLVHFNTPGPFQKARRLGRYATDLPCGCLLKLYPLRFDQRRGT